MPRSGLLEKGGQPETSQLYHAPWIDAIRQTTLGGLVLGFGFLLTDLVCYSFGVMIDAIAEWAIVSRMGCCPSAPAP